MTAPNHALTGAVIGLSISNPWLALPLAFLSHFVCDAIPHYDQPEQDTVTRLRSRRFLVEFLIVGATICLGIVLVLAAARPHHWLQAAIGAFLAASPDLFWIQRYLYIRRHGIDRKTSNLFLQFHSRIQWKTGPQLLWVEIVWFVCFALLMYVRL